MSMCRVFSCVVGRVFAMTSVFSQQNFVSLSLTHFVLQGQTCLLLQVSPDFLLLHSNPLWRKGQLFLVLVLEGLVGLHRTIQLQLLQHYWLGHSVQFSHSVVSDSLLPHGPQHARPPCPSPTPGVHLDSRPSSQWCHPAISSPVVPFSSCPQSLPVSGSFPMSQLFASGGQSIGASTSNIIS